MSKTWIRYMLCVQISGNMKVFGPFQVVGDERKRSVPSHRKQWDKKREVWKQKSWCHGFVPCQRRGWLGILLLVKSISLHLPPRVLCQADLAPSLQSPAIEGCGCESPLFRYRSSVSCRPVSHKSLSCVEAPLSPLYLLLCMHLPPHTPPPTWQTGQSSQSGSLPRKSACTANE